MMSYEVLEYFEDLTDKNYPYNKGDNFPRKGLKVSKERFSELESSSNKRGIPLIRKRTSDKTKEN